MGACEIVGRLTLGEFVELQRGTTYKSSLLDRPGPLLLGLASIQRNGGFRSDSLRPYGGASPDKLILRPGDLYVSLKDVTQSADLLGAVARVPTYVDRGRLTQDTVKLVFKEDRIPPNYLYWVLRTPAYREYCRAHAIGTTNLSLSRDDFFAFPISIPNSDGLILVATLEALDEKIELNHRMSETLEAMARTLFTSWFFKELREGCLEEDVDQLFERKILQVGDGYRAKNDEMGPMGLPFARAGNIDNGFSFRNADLLSEKSVAKAGDKVSRPYDVVFTSKGTVGRFAFVDPAMQSFVYSPQLCFWRSLDHNILNPFVLQQWIQSRWFLDQVDRVKGQTDMAEYVSLRDQRRMRISIPSPAAQRGIADILSSIQNKVWKNVAESKTLTDCRDLLLSRLLASENGAAGTTRPLKRRPQEEDPRLPT